MKVQFYKNSRGDYLVCDYIENLKIIKHQKKIYNKLRLLEKIGHEQMLRTQDVKKIKGYDNIYELRISYQNCYYRIFFSIFNNSYWLLHAFMKKSDKTPASEIETAFSRYSNLLNNE